MMVFLLPRVVKSKSNFISNLSPKLDFDLTTCGSKIQSLKTLVSRSLPPVNEVAGR